jgi:hypothetical protein
MITPLQQAKAIYDASAHHGLDTDSQVCFYEQEFYPLSNFSSFMLAWKERMFQTVEHAYHWESFATCAVHTESGIYIRDHVMEAASAHEALKRAQWWRAYRRKDWDDVKVDVMRALLRAKATQHEYVRRKLLETGERLLIENSWRDSFWGWGPNRDGQNMLGKLWMEVREEFSEARTANYPLFAHMSNEHKLTLTESELDEICNVVARMRGQSHA